MMMNRIEAIIPTDWVQTSIAVYVVDVSTFVDVLLLYVCASG